MSDCFSCPQPGNYAAVATILQRTALEAEACIFDVEQRLRGAVNLPTVIQPATLGGTPSGVRAPLVLGTATFANSAFTNMAFPLPRGVYQAGVSFVITATGVTNDNTYRIAEIATRNQFAPLSVPDNYNAYRTTWEASTGNGMDMGLHTVVESDGNDYIRFYITHGNTSSTMTVTSGIAWIARLSDLDAPRVVA